MPKNPKEQPAPAPAPAPAPDMHRKKSTPFRYTDEQKEVLDDIKDREGVPYQQLIEMALADYLPRKYKKQFPRD